MREPEWIDGLPFYTVPINSSKKNDNDVERKTMKDYKNVTYLEFIEKEQEMFDDLGHETRKLGCGNVDCEICPLSSKNNGLNCGCEYLRENHTEEYIKIVMEYGQQVDWNKVSIDTKIQVKWEETDYWQNRYFAKYEDEKVYAWSGGKTSFTAIDNEDCFSWRFARLYKEDNE